MTDKLGKELTFKQKYFVCDDLIDNVTFLNRNKKTVYPSVFVE